MLEVTEIRPVIPGEHGLECIFYAFLTERTKHLFRRVYITCEAEGVEFRPRLPTEHFPRLELIKYQARELFAVKACGKGRTALEVTFRCYSPAGSGAANEAAALIAASLVDLEEVAKKDERARSKFSWGCTVRYTRFLRSQDSFFAYRPPPQELPFRPRVVVGSLPKEASKKPPTLSEIIEEKKREYLNRWGLLGADERLGSKCETNERGERWT